VGGGRPRGLSLFRFCTVSLDLMSVDRARGRGVMAVPKPFYHERNGRVFLICPIGAEHSPMRKRADDILQYLVRPAAVERCGFQEVIRADLIASPGEIPREIVEHLIEDDLVVADLHDHNPNVFYELGVRHSVGKPVIQIAEKGESIPFDIFGYRTIKFRYDDIASFHRARDTLVDFIEAIKASPHPVDSPVSTAFEMLRIRRSQNLIDILALMEPTRKTRHLIYQAREAGQTWKDLTDEQLQEVDDLCRKFDTLGLYDRLWIVNSYHVDMFYSVPFVDIYKTFIQDYVAYLRAEDRRGPRHFWELVKFYERVKRVPENHPATTHRDDWPEDPRS
jgi:hypothetical protein